MARLQTRKNCAECVSANASLLSANKRCRRVLPVEMMDIQLAHTEAWVSISLRIQMEPGQAMWRKSRKGRLLETYQRKGEPIGRRDHMVPKVPVGVNFLDMLFLTTLTPTLSLDPVFF